ncbi:ATP-binding protein [Flavihumibacter stibioxidans]|uniref:Histidine kinase domain-containing protein n=1 Tax=Flavihumibacter stibioxidans TaxID=1834163 RepID=A0ABR7M3Q6_9BACT|nr:sensor histidine kinase [Flavihumibacter stibioxidans]MBC6489551.1 hypothetical protein [Flavihumibacter stibioxidans]
MRQKIPFIWCLLFFLLPRALYAQDTEHLVDSMEKRLLVTKEDTSKVLIYIELGNLVSYYDAATAARYVNEGLDLSRKIKYLNGIGRCSYLLGFIYQDLNDYKKSLQMLELAEQVAQQLQQPELMGKVHNARGSWYFLQSDMYNAAYHFSKATEQFQLIGDTLREIAAYQNLIAALGEVKSYERAVRLSEQLLEILSPLKDTLQMGYALNHLVVNYMGLRKIEDAGKYVRRLLPIIQKTRDFGLASDSYDVIGDYFLSRNLLDSAILYYKMAMDKSLRKDHQAAQSHLSLGIAYLKMKDFDQSFQHLSAALELSGHTNTRDVYYRTCQVLSEYYEQKGDIKNAHFYLSEYVKLNDSILVAETRQYASYLEVVYESQKKEKAITDLKLQNSVNELGLVKRNRIMQVGGVASGSVLILLGLLYRNSRNKSIIAEKDRLLQEEQIRILERQQQVLSLQSMVDGQEAERTRIAKDLHDGLGGLFSTVKMHFSSLQHEQQALQQDPLFLKSYELIHTASEEVRRIAHNMMPEVLIRLGLVQATRDLCNSISAGKKVKVSVQDYGMDQRMEVAREIMLFRILQELLNNIIKHAQASEAIVQFNRDGQHLSITVEDNGRGFNVEKSGTGVHAGLASISSRVQYLNGKLSIDSRNGIGTTVMMDFLFNDVNSATI